MDQPGFFDIDERLARLSGLGDQLKAFSRAVDFEVFRPALEAALSSSASSKGGRPPVDPVMMFKILVIHTINTLSDERTEYLTTTGFPSCVFSDLGFRIVCRCQDDLAVPGVVDEGRGDHTSVRTLRRDVAPRRVYSDVRPDRRCLAGGGAASAQYEGGESRHQGGEDTGSLEGQARSDHPHHRHQARRDEDRPRKPRLQHTPLHLPRAHQRSLKGRRYAMRVSLHCPSQEQKTSAENPATDKRQHPSQKLGSSILPVLPSATKVSYETFWDTHAQPPAGGRGGQSMRATIEPFGVLKHVSYLVGRPLLVTNRRQSATPMIA